MTYNLRYESANGNSINFSPISGIVISDIDGLTSVHTDMATSQGISQVGETIRGKSIKGKPIVITGSILGESQLWRKHLIDTIVPDIPGRLVFNNELFLEVEVVDSPDVKRERHGANYQFILKAGYPYWQSMSETSIMLSGHEARFRFPINYGDPSVPDIHNFGMSVVEEYRNAINSGNVPVPFRVLFRAITPVLNPKVVNIETLESVGLDKRMEAGELVIVDMTRPMISVVATNSAGVVMDDFDSFEITSTVPFLLRQGDNLLRQDADSGRDNLHCTVFYRTTMAGAYM